jgi:hypothetical protein
MSGVIVMVRSSIGAWARRFVCVASVVLLTTASLEAGDARIEGDADLLRAIRDAQITAEGQYRRGSLTAEIDDEWVTGLHSHSVVNAVWDKQAIYWETEFHMESAADPASYSIDLKRPLKDHEKEVSDGRMIVIETPGMSCRYRPDGPSATIRFGAPRKESIPVHEFRPAQVWHTFHRAGAPWSRQLDPAEPQAPEKFVVRREDADHVIVERHLPDGESLKITVSLAIGGRVEQYEYTPRSADRATRSHDAGRFTWEQLGPGVWIVRETEQTHRFSGRRDPVVGSYRMKVLKYDPNPTIARDRFDVAALQFPSGTRVSEIRGTAPNRKIKSYTVGKDAALPQALLDKLAEELKKEGFGRPE